MKLTPDERAALERLRAKDYQEDMDFVVAYGLTQYEADCESLAHALLRLCPGDDGEPIDEAFLKSLGFIEDLDEWRLEFLHNETDLSMLCKRKRGGWHIGSGSPRHTTAIRLHVQPATGGQLRRLAYGLGIVLKEGDA